MNRAQRTLSLVGIAALVLTMHFWNCWWGWGERGEPMVCCWAYDPPPDPFVKISAAIDVLLPPRGATPAYDAAIDAMLARRMKQAEEVIMPWFSQAVRTDPLVRADAASAAKLLNVDLDAAPPSRDLMLQALDLRRKRIETFARSDPTGLVVRDLYFTRSAAEQRVYTARQFGLWPRIAAADSWLWGVLAPLGIVIATIIWMLGWRAPRVPS